MESPIPSQEVITLGKKIAAELAKHDRTSPTIKWVSQYLAEIIHRAEKTKDKAEKAKSEQVCVDIILKLWKQKAVLPHGAQPMSGLRDALDVLLALKEYKPTTPYWQLGRDLETYSPFGKFVAKLREDHQLIFKIVAHLVLAGNALKREKEWAKFPNLLSEDEKTLIDELDWLVSQYCAPALKRIALEIGDIDQPPAPEDRINLAFDKMAKLYKEELAALEDLRAHMLKKPSKKTTKRPVKKTKPGK
ncbi:hypothetical protein [Mucilaginibacter flavidus]|uniref:hypothetical protein n=1 Tax=Mucilaginibacter flavidus TaxID=2949309 RepID=UPI0020929AE5|nr:hypothetical protein [Mucilaginibacter flavidus]MCO5950576.1 hypothetical protein [Mucilaginibacter flavidus]